MKRLIIITIALICAIAVVLCIPVQAETLKVEAKKCTYEVYTIQKGETLTEISEHFNTAGEMSTQDYINELVRINHLESDQIHSGCYLTVISYQ